MTNNLKIFVVYYKPAKVFRSEIFEPIQAGAAGSRHDLGMLRDDTGDNISKKNRNYGELTAWYWVWKNWLPAHPEVTSVGFCHYRRFFDFTELQKDETFEKERPFHVIPMREFEEKFNAFDTAAIEKFVSEHETILPNPEYSDVSLFKQFARWHPTDDLVALREIFKRRYPEDLAVYDAVLSDRKMYPALNFVMTRDRFNALCEWLFGLLFELERQSDFSRYGKTYNRRLPALIAERMLTVWLTLQQYSITHLGSYRLFGHEGKPKHGFKKFCYNLLKSIRLSVHFNL